MDGQPHKTGIWTEAEDEMLFMWQQRIGNKWSEVARHIPGKTGQQCAQRWRHRVNPDIKRDKWSSKEDALLVRLVEMYGNQWALIARNVPGRTDQQCMGRWRRHLDPLIRRERWKTEEDVLLMAAWNRYQNQWAQISKVMCGRTPQQCRTRYQHITQNMTTWLDNNKQRIAAVDVEAVEQSRGLDMNCGARNAKDVVKKEGEEMRERAAKRARGQEGLPALPDALTLETELVSELERKGIKVDGVPILLAASGEDGSRGGTRGSRGSTPSAMGEFSKGSTPSAPGVSGKNSKKNMDGKNNEGGNGDGDGVYWDELEMFKPVDVVKLLRDEDFPKPSEPKGTSVKSFQPAAALRLTEPHVPGTRWEQPYLPGHVAMQPFQPFKEFSPHQGPLLDVKASMPMPMAMSRREVPVVAEKPVVAAGVAIATPALTPEAIAPSEQMVSAAGGSSGEVPRAKRTRETVEWVNPDLEEERRLRELGGSLMEAKEEEVRRLLHREGAVW